MQTKNQGGFTLIELVIATAISTIVLIASAPALVAKIEDAGMEGTGAYMAVVKTGLERYNLKNYDALAGGTAQTLVVPALGNAYAPTVAELVRDKYISGNSLLDVTPQRQRIKVQITTPNCPGPSCTVVGLAYTTSPLVKTGTTDIRHDLLATFLASPGVAGFGLITKNGTDGSTLAGNNGIALPNPLGAVPGILAISTFMDQALYASFVRRLDTRDPDLRGGMTLSGVSKDGVNTLNVTGPTALTGPVGVAGDLTLGSSNTTPCIKLFANGQIDVNCNGIVNAKAGTFIGPSGTVKAGNTGNAFALDSTGKVQGQSGFYTLLNSLFGDNPNGARFGGTDFTVQNASGTNHLSVDTTGAVQARRTVATPILSLTDTVVLGQACGTPSSISPAGSVTNPGNTAIASAGNGAIATCIGGVWTEINKAGSVGATCSPQGALATDPNGVALICQNGRFASLADRFGSLVFSESTVVSNAGLNPAGTDVSASPAVNKPLCASTSEPPRAYIVPNNETQNVQKVNRYLQDNGSTWLVYMLDGNRRVIPDATATVQTYCVYN